jgi:hypothetical protein
MPLSAAFLMMGATAKVGDETINAFTGASLEDFSIRHPGPFKTRVFGPPEPKVGDTSNDFNWSNASPLDHLVLALSGVVRTIGQILGVS